MASKSKNIANPAHTPKKSGKQMSQRKAQQLPEVPPSDVEASSDDKAPESSLRDGMSILGGINARLRVAPAVLLPTTDQGSACDDDVSAPTKRKAKGMSGKLRTADTTVVHQITCPH